jgi:hypothetical protein
MPQPRGAEVPRGCSVRRWVVNDAQRADHAGLYGMQAAELYDDEKQNADTGRLRC